MRLVLALVLLSACGRDERRPADVVERARIRIEAKDVAQIDDDVAPEVVPDSIAAPALEVVIAVDASELATVTREACEAACQNAMKVTLAELSADEAPAMRTAIEKAMREKCPTQCVERASLEAVQCIGKAKTALELASCPH